MSAPEVQNFEDPFSSLVATEAYFEGIFGRRNSINLDSRLLRIDALEAGVFGLGRALRDGSMELKERSVAQIGARTLAVVQNTHEVTVAGGLDLKFPDSGCAYCGNIPCACGETRPDPTLNLHLGRRENWSLNDWQAFLGGLYGVSNELKGQDYVANRLAFEVSELRFLEKNMRKYSIDVGIQKCKEEIADVMAWAMAAATLILRVYEDDDSGGRSKTLQDVMKDRYGDGCPVCRGAVCSCSGDTAEVNVYDM